MKKILSLILIIFVLGLTSCSAHYEPRYISSYNDNNYASSFKKINGNNVYEYYECNVGYQSVYTSKYIYANSLDKKTIGSNDYYYDSTYKSYYDAFGSEIRYNLGEYHVESYQLVATESSNLYYTLTGIESNSNKLYLLSVDKFISNSGYGQNLFAFRFADDSHIYAENIVEIDDYLVNFLIADNITIKQDFETRFSYSYNGSQYSITAAKNYSSNYDYDPCIKIEETQEYDDSEYIEILSVPFPNGEVFSYSIKYINYVSNDFTFARDGMRYKSKVVRYSILDGLIDTEEDINYYPISYYYDESNEAVAYILCYKIDDDGKLSNKYYTLRVENSKPDKLSEDISPFEEGQLYVSFDGEKLTYSKDDYSLVVLTENLLILKQDISYIIKAKLGGSDSFYGSDYRLLNNYSINGKYYFINSDNNELLSVSQDGNVDYIYYDNLNNQALLIYEYDNLVYFNNIALFSIVSSYSNISVESFYCDTYKDNIRAGIIKDSSYIECYLVNLVLE